MSEPSFRRDWIIQADLRLGAPCAAHALRHRARGDRGRRRVVGRRPVRRQSRLGEAARGRAVAADGRGAGVPRRSRRRALPHAQRLADHLRAVRPAARGVGLSQAPQVLRHDHSEGVWRARLFRVRAFGGHPQAVDALDLGRRHRHGAEFARARRAPAPVRHQGAAGLLAAAARRCARDPLLRAHQPGGGLGRGVDDRLRRGLPRHLGGPRGRRHQAQLAQALHHAGAGRDPDRARVQALRSRSSDRRARGHRHHGRAGADRSARRRDRPPASAGAAGVPERADPRPRRLHPDRQRHRRRRAGGRGLEDADERARGRARHLAAVAVGGGRRLRRAHDRRLCAHPRAIPPADRPLPGDPGAPRPHGRDGLSARCRAPAHLRRHRSRPQAGGDHRHHEGAGDRAAARDGQRRHGRARRQGRAGRPAQLSRHVVPLASRSASRSKAPTSSPAA